MKKALLTFTLILSTIAAQAQNTPVLDCQEKFSSLTITKNGEDFEIQRSILTNRVRGPYARGGVSTESSGSLNAKLIATTAEKITFALDNGKTLNILIAPGEKSEILTLTLSSDQEGLVESLNEILKTSENPLSFSNFDACTVNLFAEARERVF